MKEFKDLLREALAEKQMKAIDLCRLTGIGSGAISQYLSGKRKPKIDVIQKIAVALNVSETWLLGYDVPMERKSEELRRMESETLEEEMSRRMLEQITTYYERLTFSGKVALFEDVKKREAGHVYPET